MTYSATVRSGGFSFTSYGLDAQSARSGANLQAMQHRYWEQSRAIQQASDESDSSSDEEFFKSRHTGPTYKDRALSTRQAVVEDITLSPLERRLKLVASHLGEQRVSLLDFMGTTNKLSLTETLEDHIRDKDFKCDDLLARIRAADLDARATATFTAIKDLTIKTGVMVIEFDRKEPYDPEEVRKLCEQGEKALADMDKIKSEAGVIEEERKVRSYAWLREQKMKKKQSSAMPCAIF